MLFVSHFHDRVIKIFLQHCRCGVGFFCLFVSFVFLFLFVVSLWSESISDELGVCHVRVVLHGQASLWQEETWPSTCTICLVTHSSHFCRGACRESPAHLPLGNKPVFFLLAWKKSEQAAVVASLELQHREGKVTYCGPQLWEIRVQKGQKCLQRCYARVLFLLFRNSSHTQL